MAKRKAKVANKAIKTESKSMGSLSPAKANEKATTKIQRMIIDSIKATGWSGVELHKRTGISLAMCRRLTRGDKTDMKVSTLARLLECKEIKLQLS